MSGYFAPGNHKINPLRNERGSMTRILLIVLLLLVAVAGYLFYFTDFIRPRPEGAKPPAAPAAQVKQPIPPRPVQPGETAAAPASPTVTLPQGAPPPAPSQAQVKPAPASPQVKSAPIQPAPAAAPPLPAAAPKPAPPASAPVASAPAAKKEPAPAKPAQKKEPVPDKLAQKKEPAPAKLAHKAEKPVVKKKDGPYRLLIGDFVPDKTFAALQSKLKKSGIAPVRKSTVTAAEPMNRLFVAEFGDQDSAVAELQKLKKLTGDAFLIPDNGKYILYAGSYFSSSRAAAELKKLSSRGVNPVVRQARVTIKVTRVTAGSYVSMAEARNDVMRLKKQGIAATVIKVK
jgi:cell division septation protein DedD